MINPIFYLANRNGIPRIKSTGVTVNGTTNVQYSFSADASFSSNFSGLVLVRLDQAIPTGTTATLPIVFTSSAGSQPLTTYDSTNVTVNDIAGTGIFLCYYDRATNVLQALTGVTV